MLHAINGYVNRLESLMNQNAIMRLKKQPRGLIAAEGFFLVLILGFVDFLSGYEISFSVFYLLPIVFVTWLCGRAFGFLVAFTSAVVWLVADMTSGHVFSYDIIPFWNALVRLGFFVTVVFLLTRLQLVYEEQKRIAHELRESLTKIKVLSGLIPICAWCKKVRNDQGYWQQVETYLTENADVSFTHGVCQECKEKELSDLRREKN
jgi:hypothetical protein